MVNNLIFRAADTATALERVQASLGPNAYIIEIKNVGNFVEITASLDEPVARPQKKVSESESAHFKADSSLDPFSDVQTSTEGIVGDPSGPQPLVEPKAAEKNQVVKPVRQQELAFENVFIEMPDGADQNVGSVVSPVLEIKSNQGPADPIVPPRKKKPEKPESKTQNQRASYPQAYELGFGDLLNLGLSANFIKEEFSIEEFEGGISKAELIQSLVDTFYDPLETAVFENHSNLVFLGTPGVGKSTVCAKLMHYYGTKYSSKPSVVHVTPEKLFEADRLNFHAKMFNFPFARHHILNNESLFLAKQQLVEIAWDYQIQFANFYGRNANLYPHIKPFLVLPAELNNEMLIQIMRICPNIKSVILNKCDYGRFSGKNLMLLYQNGCKISALSGDRTVSTPLGVADKAMMREFVEYTLKI